MAVTGRPPDFNDEIAAKICDRLAEGESLRSICREEGMPKKSTVFRWAARYPDFGDQYAMARREQAEGKFDELFDIADDSSNDYMDRRNADGSVDRVLDPEAIRRTQIRVDVRKWALSKILPKKYGDKLVTELTGANGGAIAIQDDNTGKLAQVLLGVLHAPPADKG